MHCPVRPLLGRLRPLQGSLAQAGRQRQDTQQVPHDSCVGGGGERGPHSTALSPRDPLSLAMHSAILHLPLHISPPCVFPPSPKTYFPTHSDTSLGWPPVILRLWLHDLEL